MTPRERWCATADATLLGEANAPELAGQETTNAKASTSAKSPSSPRIISIPTGSVRVRKTLRVCG